MNNTSETVRLPAYGASGKCVSRHRRALYAGYACIKLLSVSSLVMVSGMGAGHGVELAPGTLPVASTQLRQAWRNAASSLNPATNTLTIDTASTGVNPDGQNSILWWDSFNIAADSRVQFIQPSSTHIALNRIARDTNPSIINGRLDANGHVYLINPNGILFGRTSSINVNRLVASSLALNIADDNEFILGNSNIANLINDDRAAFANVFAGRFAVDANGVSIVDDQGDPIGYDNYLGPGTIGGIYLQGEWVPVLDAQGNMLVDDQGNVVYAYERAVINTPEDGDVLLFGSQIFNDGEINTPGGQTLLATTDDKVYLTPSSDTNLRGFLVEVSSADLSLADESSARLNIGEDGKIFAERGNITLAALSINHQGLLQATTSVNENGSIRLVARDAAVIENINTSADKDLVIGYTPGVGLAPEDGQYAIAQQSGRVVVDGEIHITPDRTDNSEAPDQQVQKLSRIEVIGEEVRLTGNADLLATAGKVTLHATQSPDASARNTLTGELNSRDQSKIIVESGARIDVSGTDDTLLPMSRNQIEVQATGDFLSDAPYQRDGVLRGERLQIDVREGTPLGDISEAVAGINKGLSERLANGGSIDVLSQGGVMINQGSVLDASGGRVAFEEGFVTTSRLVAANGRVVNIGEADINQQYTGVFGKSTVSGGRWGSSAERSWRLSGGGLTKFYQGYVEGRDAGAISIQSHAESISGDLLLDAYNGRYQRNSAAPNWADGGALNITLGIPRTLGGIGNQDVVITEVLETIEENQLDDFLAQTDNDVSWALSLHDEIINNSGLAELNINTNGDFQITSGAEVRLASAGRLDVTSGSILVNGRVDIDSGHVSLVNYRPGQTLEVNGDIDVSGTWVNDNPNLSGVDLLREVNLHGGSILLASQGDLRLAEDASLKANGGGWLQSDGRLISGNGGSIDLSINQVGGAAIDIAGTLQGYALGNGGTLKITANEVNIGDFVDVDAIAQGNMGELRITPEFFTRGGFANYQLTSNIDGLKVLSGTTIRPETRSMLVDDSLRFLSSRDDLDSLARDLLPEYYRRANSLALEANRDAASGSAVNGIDLQEYARIDMSSAAGSRVSFTSAGETDLVMDEYSSIYAPAGVVTLLSTGVSASGDQFDGNQAIWLNGEIDVSGTFVQAAPRSDGLRAGTLYDGGTVNIIAGQLDRDIIMADGSVIDKSVNGNGFVFSGDDSLIKVAGVTAEMDVPSRVSGQTVLETERRQLASDAGSINIYASEGMILRGHIDARAADHPGASGGSLNIALNSSLNADVVTSSAAARDIHLYQQLADLPQAFARGERINLNDAAAVSQYVGMARISADRLEESGVASLGLATEKYNDQSGKIVFHDDIDLSLARSLQITSPILQGDNGVVNLTAPYVRLGSLDRGQLGAADQASDGAALINIHAAGEYADGERDGLLEISGDLLTRSVAGLNLSSAGDIRFRGLVNDTARTFESSLQTFNDLSLNADQVYATTLSQVDISLLAPDARLYIEAGDDAGDPVLSAASRITFNAPHIEQAGVVRAPLGQLVFNAPQSLLFATGSVTSVSGEGQLVPLGVTLKEQEWVYPVNESFSVVIDSDVLLEGKAIELNSDRITFSEASLIDLSSGRLDQQGNQAASDDLYAWEFVPGLGGSEDNLLSTNLNGSFAVMPGSDSFSPYDYVYWEADQQFVTMGEQVYLQASDTLPAGLYTLLPARYALLPGAHLVTPLGGTTNRLDDTDVLLPAQRFEQLDGSQVVAGQQRFVGTHFSDSAWTAYQVEASDAVHLRSRYVENQASQFFRDQALRNDSLLPDMPEDAGSLNINAGSDLVMAGDIRGYAGEAEYRLRDGSTVTESGRGSQVNISASDISVVDQLSGVSNGVELRATDLNQLGVATLLLGGTRNRTEQGTVFDVTAGTVTVDDNVDLNVNDLVLAATDMVTVRSGAHINAVGEASKQDEVMLLDQHGALLRVSASDQVVVKRNADPQSPVTGELVVEAGARLTASNSMVIDSSAGTDLHGELGFVDGTGRPADHPVGSLNLGATQITIGRDTAANGVAFSAEEIQAFNARELVLTSRSSVDLYGDPLLPTDQADLSFNNLTIQAAAIRGHQSAEEHYLIAADTLTLGNPAAVTTDITADGAGDLSFNTRTTRLLDGEFSISGFRDVAINASAEIAAARHAGAVTDPGNTQFDISGDVFLNAGRLTTESGVEHIISTPQGNSSLLTIAPAAVPATLPDIANLGGRLSISADAVVHQGLIEMRSGSLELQARSGNLELADGSLINMSGLQRDFAGQLEYSNGGNVKLVAEVADVNMASGATIDVSSPTDVDGSGADAGRLTVSTPQGQASLDGGLLAAHGRDAKGGYFELDTQTISELASLNTRLNSAGFNQRRSIRLRDGDLVIADVDALDAEIIAREVSLSADNGNLVLQGQIDASGAAGGRVELAATGNVELAATAIVDASASDANREGGYVFMETCGGSADLAGCAGAIDLVAGSVIDVSGGGNAAGGKVHFRVPRTPTNNGVQLGALDGDITGFRRFDVEGYARYDSIGQLSTALDEASSFMLDDVLAGEGLDTKFSSALLQNVHLRPGIEINSELDVSTSGVIDFNTLANAEYINQATGQQESGILTLRSGGDVNINASLQDGFASDQIRLFSVVNVERLVSKDAWSYRLVAGADRAAARSLDVVYGEGDVNLASGAKVRTGTGDIDVVSGGRLSMAVNSAIYTGGKRAQDNPRSALSFDLPDPYNINTFDAFFLPGVEFPVEGGDVRIRAGTGIAANVDSFMAGDWLHRAGGAGHLAAQNARFGYLDGNNSFVPINNAPVMKGVSFIDFHHGIGALGGGHVVIESGGDISNLAVSVPTSIKPVDDISLDIGSDIRFIYDNGAPESYSYELSGGGDIDVYAEGDINRGMFLADSGSINISATGQLGAATSDNGIFLVAADSQASLVAGGAINLLGIANTTYSPMSPLQYAKTAFASEPIISNDEEVYFNSFSADSDLSLSALGEVNLINRFSSNSPLGTGLDDALQFYPASLQATSFDGNVSLQRSFIMTPSPQGNLSLLANGSVIGMDATQPSVSVFMPDIETSRISGLDNPSATFEPNEGLIVSDVTGPNTGFRFAQTPLHVDNNQAVRVVARTGDIKTGDAARGFFFALPKKAELFAGRDIFGVGLANQHLDEQDITLVEAGRDIRYIDASATENISPSSNMLMGIKIGGPGQLQVLAGRTISLGDRQGIIAEGSSRNSSLGNISQLGADILVMAGIGEQGPNYDAFIDYLFPANLAADNLDYADELIDYTARVAEGVDAGSDFATALAAFRNLPEQQQRQFLLIAFNKELAASARRTAGEEAESDGDHQALAELLSEDGNLGRLNEAESRSSNERLGYSRGLDAIATLFPGTVSGQALANGVSEDDDPDTLITAATIYQVPEINLYYDGDLALTSSIIKAEADGSDILIAAPGGIVNVGLTVATGDASDRGIITKGDGHIGIFAHNDISVNESRVQALAGGDILGWSSKGNVDAGRGATTLLNVPPPRPVVDPNSGEIRLVNDVSVEGSGIRATSSAAADISEQEEEQREKANHPGFHMGLPGLSTVVLAAPDGVIDAGDAGILASTGYIPGEIINAGNVEIAGGTGLPSVDAGVISVPVIDPNAAGNSGDSQLVAEDASDQFGAGSVAILRVEVIDLEEDNSVPTMLPESGRPAEGTESIPEQGNRLDEKADSSEVPYMETSMLRNIPVPGEY